MAETMTETNADELATYTELAEQLRRARECLSEAVATSSRIHAGRWGQRCKRALFAASESVDEARSNAEEAMLSQHPELGDQWLSLFFGEPARATTERRTNDAD